MERPDQEYVDIFWKISSDDPEERVEGIKLLISSTDSEIKWKYGIKRLVKGLASPKPSARLGFSTALTEFVILPYGLTVDGYFDLLNEHLPLSSGMKTKEIRNTLLGRLFGIQAISGSQLLRIDDSEGFQRFVDYAIEISVKKAWLRELAFFALVQFLKRELDNGKSFSDKEYIIQKLKDTKLDKTPEAVAVYLTIGGEWDPMAKNNATELGKILKDVSSPQDGDNAAQKGNWSPKPNFVWTMLLQELQQENEVKKTKKDKKDKKKKKEEKEKDEKLTLPVFWNIVVDQSLFSASASPERKYWGFEIFQLALGIVNSDKIGILLSPNLLRTLINQLGSSDRLLNKAAKHVITKLTDLAPTPAGPEIIRALLLNPGGSLNFDRLTKTKTIHTMLTNIDIGAVPSIVELLKQVFVSPGEENAGKALDGKRQWALDLMLGLVRRFHAEAIAKNDVEWIDEILKFMIRWGFFKDSNVKKRKADESEFVSLSHRTVNECVGRFHSVLSCVLNSSRPDNNTWAFFAWNNLSVMMGELELIQDVGVVQEDEEEEDEDMEEEEEDSEATSEVLEIKEKSVKTLEKIRHLRLSPHGDNTLLKSFEILFSLVLVQLYQHDDESVGVLSDLLECYGKLREEDDEVLTDIIVSFISRRSALLKKMVDVVWEGLVAENKVNIQLVLDVLKTEENTKGQGKLLGDDEEEEDDEDDSEIERANAEMEGDDEGSEDESDSDSDDSDSESSSSLSHNDISEADRKLNLALSEALRTKEENSDDSDNESDSSMDDEQMLALDSQLATIFRERAQVEEKDDGKKVLTKSQQRKKDESEAKESIIQFKHKALDLISVFLKSFTTREWGLEIFECGFVLLDLVRTTKDRALSEKAQTVLKQRLYKLRYQNFVAEDAESELEELLAKCHDQALAAANPGHANVLAGMSMLVSKALEERGHMEQVVRQYSDTLLEWVGKPKSRLQPNMFFDLVNWANDVRKRKDVKEGDVEVEEEEEEEE